MKHHPVPCGTPGTAELTPELVLPGTAGFQSTETELPAALSEPSPALCGVGTSLTFAIYTNTAFQ